jgi:virginiamycin B lyase
MRNRRVTRTLRGALLIGIIISLACVPAAHAVRAELLKRGTVDASGVAGGADGSVWLFGLSGTAVSHISAAGEYLPGGWSFPWPERGASGARWHGDALWVTRADTGIIERYAPGGTLIPVGATTGATALTPAPDGSMWFLRPAENQAGRVAPDGTVKLFGGVTPGALAGGTGMTFGPDGNLWFTEPAARMVGRITPAGTVTEFPLPADAKLRGDITAGPDGHLYVALEGAIGRVTIAGLLTARLTGGRSGLAPSDLVLGRDGSLWFNQYQSPRLWRLRLSSGQVEEIDIGVSGASTWATGLQRGPDGTLWFYEWWSGKAGRVLFDPPRAATGEAALLGDGRARLSGSAAARGVDTTVVFEYGLTPAYGFTTAAIAATDADQSEPIAATTEVLTPGTYHYRAIATSAIDRTVGEDRTFVVPEPVQDPGPPPAVVVPLDDGDGDGFPVGVDCDDRNRAVHPGAVDRPANGVDEDCAGGDARQPRFEPRIEASWSTTKRSVRFSRLVIDYMPANARLRLSCSGGGCKVKSYSASISREVRGLNLLKRLKGSRLRRNAVVELRLSRPGHITTVTRWKIGPPARRTVLCLPPGAKKPTTCV